MRTLCYGFILILAALVVTACGQPEPLVINTPVPSSTPLPTATMAPIQVYITGAVVKPDVYILPPDARVKQAVEAAGGFNDDADTVAINLAQPLVDGMQIHVPELGDLVGTPESVLSTPVIPSKNNPSISSNQRVNINTASLDELDTLPNIGPITAQKIVAYRESNGPFPDIESIKEVDGIGDGMFEDLRDLITVGS